MPRTGRAAVGGYGYYVPNRGNRRAAVFPNLDAFAAFAGLPRQAAAHAPMRVWAWCRMPNHFHAVLWSEGGADLAVWLHWLLTMHACRSNRHDRLRGLGWGWKARCDLAGGHRNVVVFHAFQ